MEDKIKQFQEMINESKNIVFFGGAGVSTASGIPDFRSENGLYNKDQGYNYPPEVMLSHTFYRNHTLEFFNFYRDKMCALGYKPNITHIKLAELERAGKLKAVITQNIDGLHQLAGSKKVIELHGTIHKNYCTCCRKAFTAQYIKESVGVPHCDQCIDDDAIIKPFVTLYEESLPKGAMESAINYIADADMLIVAGTSLNVYPAASLLDYFTGKYVVLINKGAVEKDTYANLVLNTDMTQVFDKITC